MRRWWVEDGSESILELFLVVGTNSFD
jgi:hypothetical protein